ncbi:MAG: hypothetical protein LAT55_06850 [Opitutales bacterium]|nr:hypothetical protein [Opitutales bacterium]
MTLPWEEEDRKLWYDFINRGKIPLEVSHPNSGVWRSILEEFSGTAAPDESFQPWNSQRIHRFRDKLQKVDSAGDPLWGKMTEGILRLLDEHIIRRQSEGRIQAQINSLEQAKRRTSDSGAEEILEQQQETLREDLAILEAEERKTIDDWNKIVLFSARQRQYSTVILLDSLIDYLHPQTQRFGSSLSATARAEADIAEQILAKIDATNQEIKLALQKGDTPKAFLRAGELFFLATYHPHLGESYLPPEIRHQLHSYYREIQQIRQNLTERNWTVSLEKLRNEPWLSHPTEEWEQVVTSTEKVRDKAVDILEQGKIDLKRENYEEALRKKAKSLDLWPHNPEFPDQLEKWILHLQGYVLHLRETGGPHQKQDELQEILNRRGQLIYSLLRPYPQLEEQYRQILVKLDQKMIPYQEFLRDLSIARQKTKAGSYLAAQKILDSLGENYSDSEELASAKRFLQKAIDIELHREKMLSFSQQGQIIVSLSHAQAAGLDETTLQLTRQRLANAILQEFQRRYSDP